MENTNVTVQPTKISLWKKYNFVIVCFLSTIPLIALGIWGILFNYRPHTVWQTNNMYWIKPIALIFFILIVEFVIVILPIIMINSHQGHKNNESQFKKDNLKKERSFDLITLHIALKKAKAEQNHTSIKQIHSDIHKTKTTFHAKLRELKKANKKNKAS